MPAPASPSSCSSTDSKCCLLVTGASGNLGRLVLRHLLDTLRIAPCRLVAGSRTPDHLADFATRGVLTRYLDFRDASSVLDAAQCVDRVLLISTPDGPDRGALHAAGVAALVAAGVQHILYTSFLNADHAIAQGVRDHRDTEALLRAATVARGNRLVGYTCLRNSLYYDNHAVWIAGNSHRSGAWLSAAQRGQLAGIARDDAALAAATALATTRNDAQAIYELASTEALTVDEIVTTIGKAIGKPISPIHVTEEDLVDGIVQCTGVRPAVAQAFASLDANIALGLAQPRGNDFATLTGRDAMTHARWVEANRSELLRLVY